MIFPIFINSSMFFGTTCLPRLRIKPAVRKRLRFHCCFLFRLSSTHRTERLTGLSLRWTQPIQQQGRRMPSLSSETTRFTWSFLVSAFLTEMVQQIHSLRERGVRLCHAARAFRSEIRAFRKSGGSACTTPPAIVSFTI